MFREVMGKTNIPRPTYFRGCDEQPSAGSLPNPMRKYKRASPNTCANAPSDAQPCTVQKQGLRPARKRHRWTCVEPCEAALEWGEQSVGVDGKGPRARELAQRVKWNV
jgi:hypothetical protein